jgi:hypothetical protein
MSDTFPPSVARPAGLFAGRADPCRASGLVTRRLVADRIAGRIVVQVVI